MTTAYHSTVLQVLPEELPDSFCIITAWNPNGEPGLPGRNRKRDRDLAERIDGLSIPRVRITGMSPDESHGEPGWAVDCSLDQGLDLAREFRQEALYLVENGDLLLVRCTDGEQTPLGPLVPRLRDPRTRRLFTLHLGCRPPRARLLPTEALEVRLRAANRFPSFTITEAESYFKNQNEDALLISIASDQPAEVLALAEELRRHLGQEGVGVSHKGIYQRVTAWSDHDFILRAWGIDGELSAPLSAGYSSAPSTRL